MEKQERKSRIFLIFAFLLTLVSLGLLAAAMGSEFWVVADIALRGGSMSTAVPENSKGVSYAHHGLFSGEMLRTDVFAVPFRYDLTITCVAATRICRYDAIDQQNGQLLPCYEQYDHNITLNTFCPDTSQYTGVLKRPGEINFWSWIVTVIFLSLAMLFGLIAAIFTMVNILYVPISDIAGIAGVYVWNIAAAVCSLVAICVWVGLHYSHLRYNILAPCVLNFSVTTCGLAKHGLAIWLCVAALLLFLINVMIIRLRRGTRSILVKKSALNVKYRKGEETLF